MMNRIQKAQARAALKAVARHSKARHHGGVFPEKVWEADDQWMLALEVDRAFGVKA